MLDGLDRRTLAEVSRHVARRLGHFGGAKGGKTTARRRSPKERSEAARKAVLARWARIKGKKGNASPGA